MHNYKIPSTTGYPETIVYDSFSDALAIVNDRINMHLDDLLEGWITTPSAAKNKYSVENRTKFYLDCLGYLLLQSSHSATQDYGIMSLYKEQSKRSRELPSDFSESSMKMSQPKKRSHERDQFVYVKNQLKKYPRNSDVRYLTVDTANVFDLDGTKWKIDESVQQYQGKRVRDDTLYDMSKIIVLTEPSGEKFFFDERFDPIEPNLVYPV